MGILGGIAGFFTALLSYGIRQFTRTFIEQKRYLLFIEGLRNTLFISAAAALIGVVIGVLVATVKVYYRQTGRFRLLDRLFAAYVALIRGTPMAVQLLIMAYIVIPSNNYVMIACIAFGLNSGAYVSEVIRAGIGAVDSGQMEAALSLGLPRSIAMRRVILPQAVKNILPALCNEFIAIIKETSIVGLIAIVDLTRASDIVRSRTAEAYFPLLSIALVYFLLVAGLARLTGLLEKRLARGDRS
ncbi:MAG: amino acid ABC transporter permease [Spirochaetaceae bacterium]|jgi:His/Glu/Gln/Arg/opine family amino acid ABC transporter permease subunit|nr:amino acid ABC transporter permease [Spirochaetaceae bacterium]